MNTYCVQNNTIKIKETPKYAFYELNRFLSILKDSNVFEILNFSNLIIILFYLIFLIIEAWLTYNITLVLGVPHSESIFL